MKKLIILCLFLFGCSEKVVPLTEDDIEKSFKAEDIDSDNNYIRYTFKAKKDIKHAEIFIYHYWKNVRVNEGKTEIDNLKNGVTVIRNVKFIGDSRSTLDKMEYIVKGD